MINIDLKLYTFEYKLHGNMWRIKVIASSVKEARANAAKVVFCPASKFKTVKSGCCNLIHGTFGTERVYE